MTTSPEDRRAHWDGRYRAIGATQVSWFEAQPTTSLELIEQLGLGPSSGVVDIGGGASSLTATLQRLGFTDLTVVDVSQAALDESRQLVPNPDVVDWICADLLTWQPKRTWHLWHDRAVFHFLTEPADRDTYLNTLNRSVEPGGAIILATFSEDGPTMCSGLPVQRYSPEALLQVLGDGWSEIATLGTEHLTPSGGAQRFSWLAARRAEPT